MGLTQWLASQALHHCSVLPVEMPGGWRVRMEVEDRAIRRGWRLADSPAAADLLIGCGPVPSELAESVEAVWEQMPGPRARAELASVVRGPVVDEALDDAVARLSDLTAQRQDASSRGAPAGIDDEGMEEEGMGDEGMDMAPDGIALAEGADDRDGLEMDELHLRLGPVLRHWPAGLEMTWTLHGDLVAAADGSWLWPAASRLDGRPPVSAMLADSVCAVLRLAGWAEAADRALHVRRLALTDGLDTPGPSPAPGVEALVAKVRGSRTLRWSLRGLRPLEPSWVAERGMPTWWSGDTHDRLLALLDALRATADAGLGMTPRTVDEAIQRPRAQDLAELCVGLEMGAARLVVASLALPVGAIQNRMDGARA